MEKIKALLEKFKNNKKAQIITIVVIAILLIAIILVIFLTSKNKENDALNSNTNAVLTGEDYRVIDGVLTDKSKSNLLPVAIVIENYIDVRPQHSLGEANIVYEALAEGGITRFLAIFSDGKDLANIGPVRSARHYFVNIAEEYGGIFAHIGGSPQALGILSFEEYITDLNQFTYSKYYWRDENIAAPHNLFTSSELMDYAVRDLISENPEGDYTPWTFKDETSDNLPNNEIYIKIDYSLDSYLVEWKYDKENNVYKRFNGNEEHKDATTDEQITSKNIIVQFAETGLLENENERLDIKTIGSGTALIFNNGQYTEATWEKDERGERTMFYDANDQPIEFNRGNIWVEIVTLDTPVEWLDASSEIHNIN